MANPRKTGRTPQQNQRQRPGQVEKLNVVQDSISIRNQIRELARPNLFQVEINFPAKVEEIFQVNAADIPESQNNSTSSAEGVRLSTFLVKAANLPASTVGVVEVPFRGRTLKIAGDRTFEPWTVTVMNDENFLLRRKLEEWSRTIQSMPMNYQTATSIAEYQSSAWSVSSTDRAHTLLHMSSLASGHLTSAQSILHGIATILLRSTPLSSKFNTGLTQPILTLVTQKAQTDELQTY